ncbi:hypothetical protein Pint_36518 [Pistacia integerrima]|uniref:Uncharacterized protein n=1 Tax=Pistacia integerrima TaxID=434235 RepID=A0ACC0Y1P3_9ROSI|nr:hypothetical protein Pint_36518 [Pistacia integerrima]
MAVQACNVSPAMISHQISPAQATVSEPVWYINSRATDHVTTDLSQLFVNASYTGQDQTQVGNCERLNISHTELSC